MSEVNPADLAAGDLRTNLEVFHDDAADAAAAVPQKRAEREGLPPGYRMRADAHYVDQLVARSDTAPIEPVPSRRERGSGERQRATIRDVREPETVSERASDAASPRREPARDGRLERVIAQLTADVAAIGSAASAVAGETTPLARRVSMDLIQSQAWRAAWLLRAVPILDGTHRWGMRPRNLGAILGQVRDRFGPECRLAGVTLQMHASDWNAMVSVDEPALVAGLSGAIIAALASHEDPEGITVRVTCSTTAGELRTVDVYHDGPMVAPHVAQRFFDPSWTDRPGGWLAGFAAAAARAVAQQHGGSAALAPGEPHGSVIRLHFYRTT